MIRSFPLSAAICVEIYWQGHRAAQGLRVKKKARDDKERREHKKTTTVTDTVTYSIFHIFNSLLSIMTERIFVLELNQTRTAEATEEKTVMLTTVYVFVCFVQEARNTPACPVV